MKHDIKHLLAGTILATLFLPLNAQERESSVTRYPGGFDFDLQHVRTDMSRETFTEESLMFEVNKKAGNDVVEVSVPDDSFVEDSTLYIPSTVMHNGRQYRVVAIRQWGLAGCMGIRRIIIGEGVKAIYERAFLMCANLEGRERTLGFKERLQRRHR